MSNDDLHHTSDDEARTRPSDTRDADPQVNMPDFPEFGELPGFTPLPDLAPLPELAPLPDLDDLLAATPSPLTDEADTPLPASALMPDGPSSEEAVPTSTDTAFPIVATASSQVKTEGDQATTELHAPGVRRRFDRLPRRSRLSRGRRQPSRHRHRLRCVRGTTRPPMVFDRPLSESRIQPLHARVRLERRQRLLPRRHHRQDDR